MQFLFSYFSLLCYFVISFRYFESLVGKLIDAYFKVNKEMAEKAIANRLELWKFKPLFHVAGEVELKSVFGKEACKMFVRENWGKVIENFHLLVYDRSASYLVLT